MCVSSVKGRTPESKFFLFGVPGFKRSSHSKITFLRTEKAKNVNKRREKKPFFSLLFAAAYECIQCKRLLGAQKSDLRIARSFEPGHSEEKELRFGCSPLLIELAHTNLTQNSTIQFDALLVRSSLESLTEDEISRAIEESTPDEFDEQPMSLDYYD